MTDLKAVSKALIPPALLDVVTLGRRRLRARRYTGLLRANRALEGSRSGRRAVFLGNGPSLKEIDLKGLGGVDIFVCNDFFFHPDAKTLEVTGYFNLDPSEAWVDATEAYCDAGGKPGFFVLPAHLAERVSRSDVLRNQAVHYITHFGLTSFDFLDRTPDKPLFLMQNVVVGFMLWADFLGYDEAGLLGIDFSFLSKRNKRHIAHFYDISAQSTANVNSNERHTYSRACLNTHRVMERIRAVQGWSNTRFVNLTEGSFLEYLPFGSLDGFLSQSEGRQ